MAHEALREQAARVKAASRVVARAPDAQRTATVFDVAQRIRLAESEILAANQADLAAYGEHGPGRDRLVLDATRLAAMAEGLEQIAALSDPLYEVLNIHTRPNGLEVEQIRVPLGVVGVIYENRPNVTTDVAGLCVRSGNAAFLRGSASAQRTNERLVKLWQRALGAQGLPEDAVSLVADSAHDVAAAFMGLSGTIDCLIPRGGPSLLAAVREHARVPYVLDGEGNCHVYIDRAADIEMALAIVQNAKMSRPGVCNAVETVLVHADIAATFLPLMAQRLAGVQLRADERSMAHLGHGTAATENDFAHEFLDLVLAVATVASLDDAIDHVATFGSGHSEAIVTNDDDAAARWVREVDAAAVLVNASTRFIDGGELGLGAEVGISTQKLHARGPMGVKELTCLKWVVKGKGQIR